MSLACHVHVICLRFIYMSFYLYVLVCHSYVARVYSYVVPMSLVCTRMSSVFHSYVLVCHPHVTRMYSYVIRMSLVCTRMSSVCHSYVLACHPCVTRMWFYHEPTANFENCEIFSTYYVWGYKDIQLI